MIGAIQLVDTEKSMSNTMIHIYCLTGKPTYLLAINNYFRSVLSSLAWNFACLGAETSLVCLHNVKVLNKFIEVSLVFHLGKKRKKKISKYSYFISTVFKCIFNDLDGINSYLDGINNK